VNESSIELHTETAIVEAILFLEADPIDERRLARIAGLSKEIVAQALANLEARYTEDGHGLELRRIGEGFQLLPKRYLWDSLKDRYGKRNEQRLSRAAIETLSIIAYSQPITRAEIENIRGVSADGMIRQLQARNLIREVGKKDAPGRPTQFGTTKEFLQSFGLGSIADLPKLGERDEQRFQIHED
jgi:segregation and condensation protein B